MAILAADGVDTAQIMAVKQALKAAGALAEVVSKFKGTIKGADGRAIEVDKTFLTGTSVMYDAIYVPGGTGSVEALKENGEAVHFINEAFKHCKPIAATGAGVNLLQASDIREVRDDQGVITDRHDDASSIAKSFIDAIAQHRNWNRAAKDKVPA